MRYASIQPDQPSKIAGHIALATRARDVLRALGFYTFPSGQHYDELGFWWCPTDAEDWEAGGAGNPLPRMDHPTTVLAFVALVRERHQQVGAEALGNLERCLGVWLRGEGTTVGLGEAVVALLETLVPDGETSR